MTDSITPETLIATARSLYGGADAVTHPGDVNTEYTRALVELVASLIPTGYDADDHRRNVQDQITAAPLVLLPQHEDQIGSWCPWSECTVRGTDCPACGDVGAE